MARGCHVEQPSGSLKSLGFQAGRAEGRAGRDRRLILQIINFMRVTLTEEFVVILSHRSLNCSLRVSLLRFGPVCEWPFLRIGFKLKVVFAKLLSRCALGLG